MGLDSGVVDVELIEDEPPLPLDFAPQVVVEHARLGSRGGDAVTRGGGERVLLPGLDADERDDLDRHGSLLTAQSPGGPVGRAPQAGRPLSRSGRGPHLGSTSEELNRLGLVDEEDIVLDEAALSLSLLDHRDTDLTSHQKLIEAVATRLDAVGRNASSARARADSLSQVLAEEFGFVGDRDTYDDPANADMIRVLDRRRGLPVSLSILYVPAARRLGWTANLLDVPGHVLVLIGDKAAPVVVDPFRGGVLVGRDQLAAMVTAMSPGPTTAVRHVAAMPNRVSSTGRRTPICSTPTMPSGERAPARPRRSG